MTSLPLPKLEEAIYSTYNIMDEDKSKEKRLEDVPVVQEFPEVFPEDLPVVPAGSSSSVPADYVSAGHVLVSADRDIIC
ncbi:hypothetical protein Tco_0986874 [Tanacetum coccineum]